MNLSLAKRVGSAAAAAWWMILIAVIWMTVGWLATMGILWAQPDWVLRIWGGGALTWEQMHRIILNVFAVFKVVLLVLLLGTIWLTLWSRMLKRAESKAQA